MSWRISTRSLIGPTLWLGWALAVLVGMAFVLQHQAEPAQADRAPNQWPATARLMRDPSRLTLVMLLHPHCPCSRASVNELGVLMARSGGRVAARVEFVAPVGAPADWIDTDLWRQAKNVPDAVVSVDQDGKDATAFGAEASGQVNLYNPQGNLLFHGGITDGRGHEGDNAGLNAVVAIAFHRTPRTTVTPVYGCNLMDEAAEADAGR